MNIPVDSTPDPEARARGGARRAVLWAVGIPIGAAMLTPLFVPLEVFNAGGHALTAMAICAVGTIFIGAGLMALAFYSHRSGRDAAANADENER